MASNQAVAGSAVAQWFSRGWIGALCVAMLATLSACGGGGGGGGGGGSATGSGTAPLIAIQPQSQTVNDGQPVTFSVGAAGTAPLSYLWLRAGQPIDGATQSSYTLPAVQLSDSGTSFSVRVTNAAGSVTSSPAVLTVQPVAPGIADNAARTVSVLQGSAATFTVTATGSAPLTFQWRRNGAEIAGATTSTYTTGPTTPADNGAVFDVVVTNAAGSVTSGAFTLQVTPTVQAPSIATQPQPVTVRVGGPATFSVTANGTAPFTYQWLRDGQPISGAQAATYTIANTQAIDNNATFSVVVTNAAGSATSAGAVLMVTPLPGIAVIAGNIGGPGSLDGAGLAARFIQPNHLALDSAGNLFVADAFNVRRITAAGVVSLYAGSRTVQGTADGTAAAATFRGLTGIAVDPAGNVYLSDSDASTIRRIDVGGTVTTFAGTSGVSGNADGTGTAATFLQPRGLATDAAGNVYVATGGNTIRKITPAGVVTTLAGMAGVVGALDGVGTAATFSSPFGVAVDSLGNVLVADTGNHAVRTISPAGVVTTLAGSASNRGSADGVGALATFDQPTGVSADAAGNVYVSDVGGAVVRKIATGAVVTTVAGSAGATGVADGTGAAARFAYPIGIASNGSGTLYIADRGNFDVRQVAPTGAVTRLAGLPAIIGNQDGTGSAARFNLPFSIAVDPSGNLIVGDYLNVTLRRVTPSGVVTTLAGGGPGSGSIPADGVGAAASFVSLQGLAVDPAGNVYVADRNSGTVRKVTPAGVVTTLAGTAGVAGSADGTGAAARFNQPSAIVYAADGNLYVTDGNPAVRRVTLAGVVTTIAGGAGRFGTADGTGSAAAFGSPQGIAADAAGNLYVTDATNSTIRKVTPAGVVTTIAGTAGQPGTTDGAGTAARFTLPFGITADPFGTIYVVDTTASTLSIGTGGLSQTINSRHTIRKIDASGNVTTVAGVADGVRGVKVGDLPGHFDSLTEIVADVQGSLYGTDANGVLRITLP